MFFDIAPADTRPIYVQIMDEIRRGIVVGSLLADEPLPSVRQLAGDLHVNPNTVQQAYRELEREGIVYVRRGQGTYVANSDTPIVSRDRLIRDFARRVLRDGYRHGFTAHELADALTHEAGAARQSEGEERRRAKKEPSA